MVNVERPIGEWVLAEPVNVPEERTAAGLYLARGRPSGHLLDDERRKVSKLFAARILKVGEGIAMRDGTLRPMPVQVGQTVLYDYEYEEHLIHNGKPAVMFPARAIVAIAEVSDAPAPAGAASAAE